MIERPKGTDKTLVRFRALCLELPETSEADSWGHPNFRAGKRTFAAFEWIKGRPSIAVRLEPAEVDYLSQQHEGSFMTPYGRERWISFWADEALDWTFLQAVIERAYRGVALKRMLAALDAKTSHDQ